MSKSSYNGYNYPLKGIVTSLDDPANMNRIQVYIPSYHGEKDESRVGSESSNPYPWAQVNTILFPTTEDTSAESTDNSGSFFSKLLSTLSGAVSSVGSFFSRVFKNNEGKGFSQVSPEEGDVVWLIFEGGDIRCPVYFGTAALPKNAKDSVIVDTSSTSGYGVSGYSADGSYGNTYQLAGGSLIDMVAEIALYRGSSKNYGYIYCGTSSSSLAVGILKWQASNRDMTSLIKAIYNKDPDSYKYISKDTYGSIISYTKDWKNQTLTKNSKLYDTIYNWLTSTAGKAVQDEKEQTLINTYLSKASTLGISDPTAIIFYCDMYYRIGSTADSVVKGTTDKSLEGLYSASQSISSYNGITAYNIIQSYISQGKFVKTTTTTLASSTSESLVWPVPSSRVVMTAHSSSHNGIDIKANANVSVVASHAGTVTSSAFNKTYGNYIIIGESSGSIKTAYKHLGTRRDSASVGSTVTAGQTIGTVGMTGDATTYHLHFDVYNNGSAIDPQSVTYGLNSTASSTKVYSKQQIWNYLVSNLSYNKIAAAAIMGCFETESNNISNRKQGDFTSGYTYSADYTNKIDSGSISISSFSSDAVGYGLAQWTASDRKSNLYNYAKSQGVSISNTAMQLRFMKNELLDSYYSSVVSALNSNNLRTACQYFHMIYENPAVKIYDTVYSHAQSFLNQFG